MAERVLVTGAGGFLGRELYARLRESKDVMGVDLSNVEAIPGARWIKVAGGTELARAISDTAPSIVLHAAFRNRKPAEWTDEKYVNEALADNNAVVDAAKSVGAKLLLVSSSAVYGNANGAQVIDESTPTQPVSVYGRAKKAVEDAAQKSAARGLQLCVARLFNLIGPREQPGMMLSDWVRQAAAVRNRVAQSVVVRHRRTARDFVDVRDAARALVMLTDQFQEGEVFNVASGTAVSLMDVSSELERLAGEKLPFIETAREIDPNDVLSQRGSSAKLRAATGWEPAISWRTSLADLWSTMIGAPSATADC